jgi:serine protease Do
MRSRVALIALVVGALAAPLAHAQTHRETRSQESERIHMPGPGRISMIGVRLDDVTAEQAKTLKLDKTEGALVASVNPNSPAAAAGIHEKDVITYFDGERVRSARHLTRLVQDTPAGREVALAVIRDGRRVDLRIRPEEGSWFDPRFGETIDGLMQGVRESVDDVRGSVGVRSRGRLGAAVQDLTGELPEYFGVKSGVLVTSVRPDTPAAKAGLKAGDVITAVDGKSIGNRRDLVSAIPDSGEIGVTVVREKKELTLRVSL